MFVCEIIFFHIKKSDQFVFTFFFYIIILRRIIQSRKPFESILV